MIHFILGGAKSGKSQYAEAQIMSCAQPWIYLATGRAWDDEMHQKITEHQDRRGKGWVTYEEPLKIAEYIEKHHPSPILVDCLTLWLTNLMMDQYDINAEIDRLMRILKAYTGEMVIVSNEVGQGIVPADPMSRDFQKHAGILHQKIAQTADRFTFMVAGYPMVMKSEN